MKQSIKAILRNVFGIEVCWTSNIPTSAAQITAMQIVSSMRIFDIDLILDVGANKGQFATEIRQCGYTGKIVSFEPLSQAHGELLQASAGDLNWDAYPRCALGNHDGEVEINIAGNSESSSILPMLESHRSAAPESAYEGKEIVPIKTLDAVAGPYLKDARASFLKIDTQGFEWQVLDGARDTLPHIKGILVELSLVPLYEGQHLWREVIDRLEAEGFVLWSFKTAFFDQSQGRTLQVDGIFYRTFKA
ncbi:MAG: FkbM family methyltransferase [Gallionella sp.]